MYRQHTSPRQLYQEPRISDVDETALNLIEATYYQMSDEQRRQYNISLLSYYIEKGYCKDHERAYKTIRNLQRHSGQISSPA